MADNISNSTVGTDTTSRNLTVLIAGAGNDEVSIEDTTVGGTATILMGAGNDTLSIFSSSAKKLIARGGAGKDTFNNDLGIGENGTTENTDVQEFEFGV